MKVFLVSLVLFWATCSQANIHRLALEFLQNNSTVLRSKTDMTMSLYDAENLQALKTWNLIYNPTYKDSSLISSSTYSSTPTKTKTHTLSLIKDFEWGGSFSFDNTLTHVEQEGTSVLSPATDVHGFTQGISYSQDLGKNLLGRDFYKEVDVAYGKYKINKVAYEKSIQEGLLGLASSYTNVKLYKSLVQLQREARERAEQRLKLIRRRVRDGLREKVDLYQAQMSVKSQEEQVQSAELNKKDVLEDLSKATHREVLGDEVDKYDFKDLKLSHVPNGELANNKLLKTLEEKEGVIKSSLDRVDYSFIPGINLKAGYKTNDYDNQRSNALGDGSLGGDKDEVSLAVLLTWTIGSGPQQVQKAKGNIDLRTTQMEKTKLSENLKLSESSLKSQITLLEKNIESVKTRRELAVKALEEYNKLYRRGRADLDQVIRAEEDLINTEKSFVQYLAQRDVLVYTLAFLYGDLSDYLVPGFRG